jgi:hypothetical protein
MRTYFREHNGPSGQVWGSKNNQALGGYQVTAPVS